MAGMSGPGMYYHSDYSSDSSDDLEKRLEDTVKRTVDLYKRIESIDNKKIKKTLHNELKDITLRERHAYGEDFFDQFIDKHYERVANIYREQALFGSPASKPEKKVVPKKPRKKKVLTLEQKLELKEEERRKEIEKRRIDRAKNVIKEMRKQFDDPNAYVRELIQNSIDANASKIEVSYRNFKNHYVISVADDGMGMGFDVIDKKLLTLFESTKETDSSKIGRFGVGFFSVFGQKNLEKVVVETSTGDEFHITELFPPAKGWNGEIAQISQARKRGTKVSLHVKKLKEGDKFSFGEGVNPEDTLEFARHSCQFITTPLFLQGKQVNKEFAIEGSTYQFPFGGHTEIEGVIAITKSKDSKYSFFNRRILVKENKGFLFGDEMELSFMVSSSKIDYNISRDDILKNKNYDRILMLLKQVKENLYSHIADEIASQPQYEVRKKVSTYSYNVGVDIKDWQFIGNKLLFEKIASHTRRLVNESASKRGDRSLLSFFGRLKPKGNPAKNMLAAIPEELANKKLLTVLKKVDDDYKLVRASLREVIEQGVKEKRVLSCYETAITRKNGLTKLEKFVLDQGKILLPENGYRDRDPQVAFVEEFMKTEYVGRVYSVPTYINPDQLSDNQNNFIEELNRTIKESPLSNHIGRAILCELHGDRPYILQSVKEVFSGSK
ncbi:MAG: ATP-binding protein, partial [Nanoarchaeota archaeon]|nr:ATP-binding protein [Nanoarchaeota archaeon]